MAAYTKEQYQLYKELCDSFSFDKFDNWQAIVNEWSRQNRIPYHVIVRMERRIGIEVEMEERGLRLVK